MTSGRFGHGPYQSRPSPRSSSLCHKAVGQRLVDLEREDLADLEEIIRENMQDWLQVAEKNRARDLQGSKKW